jgi:hypothetical protein
MRNLNQFNRFRITGPRVIENWGWVGDHTCGMFAIPSPIDKAVIAVIATTGRGWDHVSVSRAKRCPNWPEMEHVAQMFFEDNETAMQLHVPAIDHVNNHQFCLHWWRPQSVEIPRPPALMVGIAPLGVLTPDTVKHAREEANRLTASQGEK